MTEFDRNRRRASHAWITAAVVLAGLASRAGAETLKGTVTDADGKPVAGASVWAAPIVVSSPLDVRRGTADDQGRFALGVGPGMWFAWARRGRLGGESDPMSPPVVEAGRDPAPVAIRVSPLGRLRGRLIEAETGRPVAGGRFALDNAEVVDADGQGRFEVEGLALKYHESYAMAPGRERKRILFDTTLRPDAELEVRLPRGGAIVGRVTDTQGRPIPGAVVGYNTSGTIFSGTANFGACGPDGRYTWDGKEFGRPTRLSASAPGYQGSDREGLIVADNGRPLTVDFTLRRDPTKSSPATGPKVDADEPRRDVTGTVVGPEGRPVAGAKVRWGAHQNSDAPETKTDAEGRFRLARVPDKSSVLSVFAPSLAPGFPQADEGGDKDIRVELRPGTKVRGRVVDDTGTPFARVMVIPVITSPDPTFFGNVWLIEHKVTTDADGRFAITGVPEAGAKFDILGENLSDLRGQTLKADGAENTIVVQPGGAIRGRVVDHGGRPVRNFRILVNAPKKTQPGDKPGSYFAGYCGIGLTFTSDDGTFLITGTQTGHVHRISVLADGHGEGDEDRVVAAPLNHLPPAEALTIRLGPPHPLRVRVVADGKPVEGAGITLINGDPGLDAGSFSWGQSDGSTWDDMIHGRTDAQGWADFPGLSYPGATVLVRAPGFARRRLGWRKGERELTVALEPAAALSFEVLDDLGQPVDDAGILAMSHSGEQMSATPAPGVKGGYTIDGLPAGKYTLSIGRRSGPPVPPESITLEAGQTISKEVRLPKPGDFAPAPARPAVAPIQVGATAPPLAAKTLDDKPVALADFKGKYVLLDFWATWCGPCVAEIPHLKAVHDAFGKDEHFAMVSLSIDRAKDDLRAFLKDKDQPWTQAHIPADSLDGVLKDYGFDSIPQVFLIGPDGKVVARDLRGDAIKEAVANALKGR